MRVCDKPDRDVPKLKCGYPMPCPHHTAIIENGDVTIPSSASPAAARNLIDIGNALGRMPDSDDIAAHYYATAKAAGVEPIMRVHFANGIAASITVNGCAPTGLDRIELAGVLAILRDAATVAARAYPDNIFNGSTCVACGVRGYAKHSASCSGIAHREALAETIALIQRKQ